MRNGNRVYQDFPDQMIGYELNPEYGQFSVIIPEATVNLVTNKSVEGAVTTGYATVGGAMAATYDWQAFGACGLKLTPAVFTESGFYFGTVSLTAGSTYTASVVIQGEEGKTYYIYFATTAGALLGTKRAWIGTGHKQRIWVTTPETSTTTRRIYVTRDARYSDQNLFYADGLQVEAKPYPTTYCDGDMVGFIRGQVDYLWTGTPHASTSTRSAQTRSGGREMNLLDLGLRILSIVGLGMAALVDQSLPLPGFGELPQGTGTQAREFSLVAALNYDSPRHGQALRSALIDAFKPDATAIDQPMILRYQACDEDGDPTGDSLDIVCKYRGGLEGNVTNNHEERLALAFKMYAPLIKSTYTSGVELGYQTSIANVGYVMMRGTDGVWSNMANGANGYVRTLSSFNDGSIYAGGNFTTLGDADGNYLAKWNGAGWSSVAAGLNGVVRAIVKAPNGDIYVAGDFATIANNIARWDGANWHALGTGMNGNVLALAIGPDGLIYAGGSFTLAGGVGGTAHIAKWNGAVWAPLGTGTNDAVNALVFGKDGMLYAGGLFTGLGGAGGDYVSKWDGASWIPLGTGTDASVISLAIGPDESLYAGGTFGTAGGNYAQYIAKWNGAAWSPLGIGMNGNVWTLSFSKDNMLYAGGEFTTAGGIALSDRLAMWNGSIWLPIDINLPNTATVYTIVFDYPGNLYIGFDTTGTAVSATVTVPNLGSATAYPKVTFTGPGKLYQLKNYTTGKAIYFNLTLLAGEVATLNLDPTSISFVSNFRGNLLSTILPGSNLIFPLQPGVNNISAYFYGSTSAATDIVMSWVNLQWSLDGAVFQ